MSFNSLTFTLLFVVVVVLFVVVFVCLFLFVCFYLFGDLTEDVVLCEITMRCYYCYVFIIM